MNGELLKVKSFKHFLRNQNEAVEKAKANDTAALNKQQAAMDANAKTKADPNATYEVQFFDGKPFVDINGTAMVFVTATMFGKPMTCQLPVMDYRNKAIPNPDAFAAMKVKEELDVMKCERKTKENAYKILQKESKNYDNLKKEINILKENRNNLVKQQKIQDISTDKEKMETAKKMAQEETTALESKTDEKVTEETDLESKTEESLDSKCIQNC